MKMGARKVIHYTTLSTESKVALQSGNLSKMLIQLRKLQGLYRQRTTHNSGQLHRHLIALKQGIARHAKLLNHFLNSVLDITSDTNVSQHEDFAQCPKPTHISGRESLYKRNMRKRKAVRFKRHYL